MQPPEAERVTPNRDAATPPAASVCPTPIVTLRKRADFLSASRAQWKSMPGLILQARERSPEEEATGIRVGFTCSKKVGNSVARNRAKRRLREVARMILPTEGHEGWDYVLIGRKDATAARPFDKLQSDLSGALRKIHAS
jgi:ribonuclease P protein component